MPSRLSCSTSAKVPSAVFCMLLLCAGQTLASTGNCLEFDGLNDYVELTDFTPGNSFTVELWVNPSSTSDGQCFVGKHNASGSNRFLLGFWSGGIYVCISEIPHADGEPFTGWHHLAAVVEQSGTNSSVTVYRDGDLTWQTTFNAVLGDAGGKPWVLGMDWDSAASKGDYFGGQMDELRIWGTARSQAEIRSTMYCTLAAPPAELLAYYRFDHASGTALSDLSDSGHDGTLLNMDDSDWVASGAPLVDVDQWYVDIDNTSGTEDGLGWDTAFTTVQLAINAANAFGDGDVWVAQGTYPESITMQPGVQLYGGFEGDEATLSERDVSTYETIIDASTAGEGRAAAYHVVTMDSVTNTRLDGFTNTGGSAIRNSYTSYVSHTTTISYPNNYA